MTFESNNSWFKVSKPTTVGVKIIESINELDVALRVSEVLACEGYYIESISNRYTFGFQTDRKKKLYEICENRRHGGGADIIIKNEDFKRIGVEVKRVLSFYSFQTALGQVITFLNNDQFSNMRTKEGKITSKFNFHEGVIFANNFSDERTAIIIQNVMKNLLFPITIRTLFGIGESKIKNIKSKYYYLKYNK
jgi:hypothetical protein